MLRVWLPLTKDLRQQGLSNVTITNNGATFNSAGKLGGCYEFASGKRMQTTLPSISNLNSKAISFACWVNISSWNSSYDCLMSIADGTGWNQSRATLCRNNTASTLCWNIADGSTSTRVYTTTSLSTNTWYHIACTYDGASLKIYVNGVLNNSAAATLSIGYAGTFNIGGWSGNNYPINCKMNDVRVYSHCLSPMEVKELAKGLVLHYPLNRQGFGQENLFKNSSLTDLTSANLNTKIYYQGSYIPEITQDGLKFTWTGSGAREIDLWLDKTLKAGTYYTLSFIYRNNMAITSSFYLRKDGNLVGYWSQPTIPYSENWSIYKCTFKIANYQSNDATTGTLLTLFYSGYTANKWIELKQNSIKLEEGSITTPWSPASSDALATTMGLNGTTEYDCSGYCNNGTRTGTFSWTSDTPKYSVSTYMPKAALITHPRPVFGGTDQEWTCAMWVKLDNITQGQQAMNNFNISNNIVYSTTPLLYLNDGTNDYYMYGSQAVSAGVWTHVAFVFKNSNGTRNIYINGVLKNNYGPNKTSIPRGIPDTVTVGTNLAGYISDYRIYATALSASDVKSLYQNSAYIDSSGNVYGAVHSEV